MYSEKATQIWRYHEEDCVTCGLLRKPDRQHRDLNLVFRKTTRQSCLIYGCGPDLWSMDHRLKLPIDLHLIFEKPSLKNQVGRI